KLALAAARGAAVVLGPERPAVGVDGEPLPQTADFAEVVDPADADATDALLARLAAARGVLAPARSATPDVDVTVLEADGEPPVVFAVHRAEGSVVAKIERDAGAPALSDALTGEHVDAAALPLGPFQV